MQFFVLNLYHSSGGEARGNVVGTSRKMMGSIANEVIGFFFLFGL
jgi:hypothetical protein